MSAQVNGPTPADLAAQTLRAGLVRRKQMDKLFVIVGLTVMLACLLILLVLFIDLVKNGWPRLTMEFFTSFPSRRAVNAGILGAWVGTSLIMLVTAVCAVPVGVAASTVSKDTLDGAGSMI